MATHPFQLQVAAGLERDVEVGEELGAGGDPVHDLFGDEVGLDRGDAVAFDPFDFVQGLEQVQETLAGGAAEVAGVDAGEDDFLGAGGGDVSGGADGFADGDVAAAAAGEGDGAVGAEVVAAVLDLQEGTGAPADAVGPENLCLGRGEGDGTWKRLAALGPTIRCAHGPLSYVAEGGTFSWHRPPLPGIERPKEGEGFGDEARLFVGPEDQRDALDGGDLLPA